MATFRMYTKVRFNRPVRDDEYIFAPGGFIMELNDGREIQFDFNVWYDFRYDNFVEYELRYPLQDIYDLDPYTLTPADFRAIAEIIEFYMPDDYDPDENPPTPLGIEYIQFEYFGDNGEYEVYDVPDYIVQAYVF